MRSADIFLVVRGSARTLVTLVAVPTGTTADNVDERVEAWPHPKPGRTADDIVDACSFLNDQPIRVEVPDEFFLLPRVEVSSEFIFSVVRAAIIERRTQRPRA